MGGRGRPTVGAAVPCRPHGIGRGDQENVERGLDRIYRIGGRRPSCPTRAIMMDAKSPSDNSRHPICRKSHHSVHSVSGLGRL